jgi:protein SCO1
MSTPSRAPSSPPSPGLKRLGYAGWGVVVLVLALLALAYSQGWLGLGKMGAQGVAIGGPFVLTDQDGNTITEKALLGRPTALFFGYTNCPDACPTTLMDMTERLKALGQDGDKFNVLFVSLDPARDTPKLLKSYLESFDPRIKAATGTEAQVEDVAKKYRVYFKKVGEGDAYTLDHSTAVYILDAEGNLVTLIDYKETTQAAIAKMRRVL